MPLTFPTHLFNPARIVMRRQGIAVTGGESLSGAADIIKTDGGGFWLVSLLGIELLTPDQIRAWRVWEDTLDGGVTSVRVPVLDPRQQPRPAGSPGPVGAGSTDPYFPETVGYATPWIVATVHAAAALRATQLTINVTTGQALKGGEIFSLEHPTKGARIYRVGRVLARPAAGRATVEIRPPLREAATAGMAANFDWPAVTAAVMPEAETAPEIEFGRRASVDITFRETF